MTQLLGATIIPRPDHCVTRADISDNALKVLRRLHKSGFQAYLVGGSVRDLLLRHAPKDFDVATDASPNQIRKLFRNCRLIGRRFRLAHILFGREIIEVATFRAHHSDIESEETHGERGQLLRDNIYGTIEEDAERRDFTINAIYYNIADFSLVEFSTGVQDLEAGVVRLIGEPITRYREDAVRILRAIRFAAKLDFTIAPDTAAPIAQTRQLLSSISPSRIFDEVLKLFLAGNASKTFKLLQHHQIFEILFPQTANNLKQDNTGKRQQLLEMVCSDTDKRIAQGKPVTPAFLFASFLWFPLLDKVQEVRSQGLPPAPALDRAMGEIIREQINITTIPKRFSRTIREIWVLQSRLQRRVGKRPLSTLMHPRFRAGYDFLLLRARTGDEQEELATWWTDFIDADEDKRHEMIQAVQKIQPRRKKKAK